MSGQVYRRGSWRARGRSRRLLNVFMCLVLARFPELISGKLYLGLSVSATPEEKTLDELTLTDIIYLYKIFIHLITFIHNEEKKEIDMT